MKLFGTVLALGNCLLLGASLAHAQGSIPAQAAFDISTWADPVGIDERSESNQSMQNVTQKLNCELLLRRSSVHCASLSPKACNLVSWIYKGCKKQAECATQTGNDAKKCCDNEERLPLGGGVYYTAYLRACAPQYQPKRFDRPKFPDRPCDADYNCGRGMSKWLCDMRGWEKAGCQQRKVCDGRINSSNRKELHECCKQWPRTPKGYFSNFYQHRFNLKCPQQVDGRLSAAKSSNGDVNFRYMDIEANERNEIVIFKVSEAPVHTGGKALDAGWIVVQNEKGMVQLSAFSDTTKLKPGKTYTAVVLRRDDYEWLAPPINFTMPWPSRENTSVGDVESNETSGH